MLRIWSVTLLEYVTYAKKNNNSMNIIKKVLL